MRKENSNIYFTFLASVFMLAGFSAAQNASAATPTISNVNGTVASGQTLTIAGANMVNENSSLWDAKLSGAYSNTYGFENSSGFSFYENSGNDFPVTYDTSVKLQGSKSLKWHVYGKQGCNPNCGSSSMGFSPTNQGSSVIYARWYARFNAVNNAWPDNFTKQLGLQPNSGGIPYFDFGGGTPTNSYLLFDGSSNHSYSGPSIQNNRWYSFEMEATNSPRSMKLWVDGVLIGTISPVVAVAPYYVIFGIINYDTDSVSADLTEWMDNLTIGTSSHLYPSSRIEISGDNGVTWKWQPPISLSDVSISVSAELPTLTAANYLLRVTNNLQQTSSTYTLGSVSPVTYDITDFTTLVSSWLHNGTVSDINSDNIVNTSDLGIMMSRWN